MSESLTLAEAADALGVHYMTAYRYVRDGRLVASKVSGRWTVTRDDLERFDGADDDEITPHDVEDLVAALISGDDEAAWTCAAGIVGRVEAQPIIEGAVVPAMAEIGHRWAAGRASIGDEHRATATAGRLLGRLATLGEPRGRKRGHLVVGAPAGDDHGFPVALVAALARQDHYRVTELGSGVTTAAFVEAVSMIDPADLRAVIVVVTCDAGRATAAEVAAELADAHPGVARLIGGGAVVDATDAASLGATAWDVDVRRTLAGLRD